MNNKAVAIPVLPEHLIEEQILPRLPVKSLIRFKSVSRSWLSVICSHDFKKLHLKFSSSCQTQAIILKSRLAFPSCLLSFDNCNNFKNCVELEANVILSNRFGPPYICQLVGSCNGLVCLCYLCACFFLWNPATNQSQKINLPDSCYHMASVFLRGVGFGYVSSIDDYRIGFVLGDFVHNPKVRAYIYSLRAREWITMTTVDSELCCDARNCVVVDDTLYLSCVTLPLCIPGLNLLSGQVKLFPLDGLPNFKHCKYQLSRMKGCLSLCQTGYSNKDGYKYVSDVWMLKQPDKWDSWEKLFSIRGDMYLHYVFETGKCLVSREEQLKLIDPYDVAPEQFEEGTTFCQESRKGVELRDIYQTWSYVESFISPFGAFTSSEDEDNSREIEIVESSDV
ncbi:hypothetical protein RDABS01_040132 [Bienertia sinuspersici]